MKAHIFLVDTELQCFASLKIVEMEQIENPVFFAYTTKLHDYLIAKGYRSTYLDKKTRGWHRRLRNYHRMVQLVKEALGQQSVIYVARMDLIYANVVIGTLVKDHDIDVKIIPEGTLNYTSQDIATTSDSKHRRWNIRLAYGLTGLRKYIIRGEKIGVDCPIVSNVYCFDGMPSPYDENKVTPLYLKKANHNHDDDQVKTALVVGQPIIKKTLGTAETERKISEKIKEILSASGIEDIHYIAHPRDPRQCLYEEVYQRVTHDCLCLEEYLENHSYSVIISCCSTPLITSKIIFGDRIRSISVGMDDVISKPGIKESVRQIYDLAKVEIVSL